MDCCFCKTQAIYPDSVLNYFYITIYSTVVVCKVLHVQKHPFVPIIDIRRNPTATSSAQVKNQNIETTIKNTELTIIVHNIP